jgi:hypothetical protein
MNVKIETEAVPLPEKEYINGIFLAVYQQSAILIIWLLFGFKSSVRDQPAHLCLSLAGAGGRTTWTSPSS